MGRTVSALVTWGEEYLGAIGPFAVRIRWWAEVEPVVAQLLGTFPPRYRAGREAQALV